MSTVSDRAVPGPGIAAAGVAIVRMAVSDGLITLFLCGPAGHARDVQSLCAELEQACRLSSGTVLLDLSACTHLGRTAAAALHRQVLRLRSNSSRCVLRVIPPGSGLPSSGSAAGRRPA